MAFFYAHIDNIGKLYYCISKVVQFKREVKTVKEMLDKKRPICPQLCEQICVNIACGKYKEGERMLSVREMAVEAGVNPNTVQRAYETLETQGVLYSVRGSGLFVAEKEAGSKQILEELFREKTEEYFTTMKALGMSEE